MIMIMVMTVITVMTRNMAVIVTIKVELLVK